MTTMDACITLGKERETILSADDLLRQMDRASVQQAVIQPEDRALAVNHQEGNQCILTVSKKHANRLIPSCTANPWFGQQAIDVVLRAINQGARMFIAAPSLQGFILGDEILYPILDIVAEKQVPVYVHTGPHLHSTPWQLASLAERYPTIPFIMGHSGATDFWNDIPNATLSAPNIYLESSFARPFTMKSHLEKVSYQRGIMGSGAPRNNLEFEWNQIRQVLPPETHPDFYGETLSRLLRNVRL